MSATRKQQPVSAPETHFVLPSSTPAVPGQAGASPTERQPGHERLARTGAPPRRRPGTLLVGSEVEAKGTALLRREGQGLRSLGQRLTALAESQQQLLSELRLAVAVDPATGPAALAAFADRLGTLSGMLDWCDAVQLEIATEAARAARGQQPVDLLLLCQDVVHDLGAPDSDRQVQISGAATHTVWGEVAVIGRLLRLAFELIGQRTAGWSDIHVAVSVDGNAPVVRVYGLDGARAEPDAELVADFRIAVRASGLLVAPDESGIAGTGLVLRVPPGLVGPRVD